MSKFYICEKCGNIAELVHHSGVSLVCCGQKMTKLEAGVVEASHEKHLPVVTVKGNTVRVSVGSVNHPMTEEHHIPWIVLETVRATHRKYLAPSDKPEAEFVLSEGETPIMVYAYCNLHGLWKTEL